MTQCQTSITVKEILLNDAHIFTELSDLHILSALHASFQALSSKASQCKKVEFIIRKPQLTTSNFLFTIHSKFYLFLQMNRHYRQHALSLYSKGFRYILSILIIYSNGLALRKFSKKQYACWGGDGIYTCMTRGTRLYGRLSSLQLIEANTYRYLHELISPASIQL